MHGTTHNVTHDDAASPLELRTREAAAAAAYVDSVAHRIPKVASALGVCKRTVYRLIERGELATVKVAGHWRVRDESLAAYIKRLGDLDSAA